MGYKVSKIFLHTPNTVRNLPPEYQEVEYIENTGSSYIDTGVTFDTEGRVFQIKYGLPVGGGQTLFGNFPSWSESAGHTRYSRIPSALEWDCYAGGGYGRISYADSTSSGIEEIELGNNYIKDIPTDTILLSGNTGSYVYSGNTIKLFYRDQGPNNDYATCKVYYFKIIDNGTAIRDFVPCYRKSDSVIGMYDLANNVFYTNAGSGTFSKGDDMSPTVEHLIRPTQTITQWTRPSTLKGGYWKLDGNMDDASGNGHTGSGTSHYVADRNGVANSAYDASSSSYRVLLSNSSELYMMNGESFSIGGWIKPSYSKGTTGITGGVMGMSQNVDSYKGWTIHYDGNAFEWQIRMNYGSQSFVSLPLLSWESGERFHFAITGDGSTIRYYKNGTFLGSGSYTSGDCNTSYPLYIGYAETWNASGLAVYDDVFYMKNYRLTDDEVLSIYTLGINV